MRQYTVILQLIPVTMLILIRGSNKHLMNIVITATHLVIEDIP